MALQEDYIKKYSHYVIIGVVFFITSALLNVVDKLIGFWSLRYQITGYLLFTFTGISLIPIAWGIREITDIYFVDHVTKTGKEAMNWILIYVGAIIVDMFLLGWPLTAGFVGLAIIAGRFMGFLKLNKTFDRIKDLFKLKVGSVFYSIFAYYAIITSILGGVANAADDLTFQIFLSVFNGPIDSIFMIAVGIKLIIDITRIKKFIYQEDIKPYAAKTSLFVKDRRKTPEVKATSNHIQSTTQITRFQEEVEQRKQLVKKTKRQEAEKKEEKPISFENYVQCSNCGANTDKYLKFCINCGTVLQKERSKKKEEKGNNISAIAVRRILSPKREKILQQIAIAVLLVAFITYAFVTESTTMIVYSWVILAIFATYIIVNYIALFFAGRGFAITTVLSDIAFMFIVLPLLISIFSYLILDAIEKTVSMTEVVFRAILISTVIILEIIAVILVLSFKVKSSGMNLSQYIKYRLDFKARAEELAKDEKRAEKKRSHFDQIDKIEAHMAKQRESKVMDYEEFNFKERLKDLGSPLEDEEEKR